MRKITVYLLLSFTLLLSTTASADTTFGIGIGSLYNGFGINVGKKTQRTFSFGSIGCMGYSYTNEESSNGDVVENIDNKRSNCGIGIGYVSSNAFKSNKQAIGLSLGINRNLMFEDINGQNDDKWELNLMPTYHYFFKGIDKRGFNLGMGTVLSFTENEPMETGITLNLGFQF